METTCILSYFISLMVLMTTADPVRVFNIPGGDHCKWTSGFQEVDAGIIQSVRPAANTSDKELKCKLSLVSDNSRFTTKPNQLMIKFISLRIESCNTKLSLYDSRHSLIAPMKSLTCGSPIPKILYTSGKYLTIEFIVGGSLDFEFKFLVTSYSTKKTCDEFLCSNGKCIDKALRCDGNDSCFDGSDEKYCSNSHLTGVRSMKTWVIAVIAVIVFVFIILVIVIICCIKKGFGTFGKMFGRSNRHNTAIPVTYEAAPTSAPVYPPATTYPQQGGYPVQQPGYPPQQPSVGYPPQQPGYPPPESGYPQQPQPYTVGGPTQPQMYPPGPPSIG